MIKYLLLFIVLSMLSGCSDDRKDAANWDNLERIAQSAARTEDRVDVQEIAEWIIESRQDFLLIDIRDGASYQAGHIKDAVNTPLAALTTADSIKKLPDDKKIVVYSNGSENAAKAVVILRLLGLDSYLLSGGYNAWQQQVLNPDIPPQAYDDEAPKVATQRAISCYFSGSTTSDARSVKVHKRKKVQGFTPPVGPASGRQPIHGQGC